MSGERKKGSRIYPEKWVYLLVGLENEGGERKRNIDWYSDFGNRVITGKLGDVRLKVEVQESFYEGTPVSVGGRFLCTFLIRTTLSGTGTRVEENYQEEGKETTWTQ